MQDWPINAKKCYFLINFLQVNRREWSQHVPTMAGSIKHAFAQWWHKQLPIKPDLRNVVWQVIKYTRVLSALGHVSGYWRSFPVLTIPHNMAKNRRSPSKNASSHGISSCDMTPCSLVDKSTASHNCYFPNTWRFESHIKWSQTELINPLKTERNMFYIRTQCVTRCKHSALRL
jgi:hypothetical protein